MAGYEIEAEALAARLKKSALFPDGGVTFSGGEPLMQWPFVREVASLLPGIHLAIETSGYSSDEAFSEMTEKMNLVMMDIKHADPVAHEKWTGVDNAVILRHLEFLKAGTTPFIVRVPLIPGVNDSHENLARTAVLVSGAKALLRVELLPYHQTAGAKYPMAGLPYEPGFDTGRTPNKELHAFWARGIEAISLS
jgi:pyruvate formate lyase activating enzyme